jgi:hypothetical protein
VERVANALIDLGNYIQVVRTGELGAALWNGDTYPAHFEFYQLWSRTKQFVYIPHDETITDVWRDISQHWKFCHELVRKYVGAETNEQTLIASGMAADTVLTPTASRAAALGAALLRWNGSDPIELDGVSNGWAPGIVRDKAQLADRRAAQERDFVRVLKKYLYNGTAQERAVLERIATSPYADA